MEEPGFWDDPEVSQQVMKELKGLQDSVKEIEKLYSDYEDRRQRGNSGRD